MERLELDLPEALARFVRGAVAGGAYADPGEVVRDALRQMMLRAEGEAGRLERLKAALQVGLDQVERGEVTGVEDLQAFFDGLEAEIDSEFDDRAA